MANLQLAVRTFIPDAWIYFSSTSNKDIYFAGDDRSFEWTPSTSRITYEWEVDLDTFYLTSNPEIKCDVTHKQERYYGGQVFDYYETADESGLKFSAGTNSDETIGLYAVNAAASNPFVPESPDINIDFDIKVNKAGDVAVKGTHDGFPGFEIWRLMEGGSPELLYFHNPNWTGQDKYDLIGTGSESVDFSTSSDL